MNAEQLEAAEAELEEIRGIERDAAFLVNRLAQLDGSKSLFLSIALDQAKAVKSAVSEAARIAFVPIGRAMQAPDEDLF